MIVRQTAPASANPTAIAARTLDAGGGTAAAWTRAAWGLLFASRFRLAALFVALHLAVGLGTRLALLLAAGGELHDGPAAQLAALAAGTALDLTAALWLAAPLVLYLTALPERWFRGRRHRLLVRAGAAAAAFGALFTAVVEHYFFAEFDGRFNFVAVDYLLYPTEVAENIWQSYPTGLVLALVALASLAMAVALRRSLDEAWRRPAPPLHRLGGLATFAAGLAVATWAAPPGLARVSGDRALNEIAANGYTSFFLALRGSDAPYEGLYATRPRGEVMARLHRLLARDPEAVPASFSPGSTLRRIDNPGPPRRLNVVVVLEESLGAELVGALHPRPDGVSLTPSFDALAREGTLLTHAYSTGNRTIRAIEATTSSLPPLPGISIVRRDASVGLFTLPALLRRRGYATSFVYGGRALFDGMGRYLRRNGVDTVVEQKDYPAGTFTTAWGAADEAIFGQALGVMERAHAAGTPFYSLVLTVSNHRPFTFPEDHVRPEPRFSRRENAVRYADHALGAFLAEAKRRPFYRDTVFVLMGDHGARVYGAAEIPLPSYEVPVLFLGPGIPRGVRLDTLASSLDVPPTLLGILGLAYESRFFGQDVFRVPPAEGRALLNHNNQAALLRGDTLAVLGLHQSAALYRVDRRSGTQTPTGLDARGREVLEDTIAYYGGADLLYRNGGYSIDETGGSPPRPLRQALAAPPPPPETGWRP